MKVRELLILLSVLLAVLPGGRAQVNRATCLKFGAERSSCVECKDNYHLHGGVCYVDILSCREYVNGNICRRCENSYILVNNECCDKICLGKVYMKLQHSIENQLNQEETRRKAEIEGYEKAVSVLAKNSIKAGQNYEIISSRSQYFSSIYRYQVKIDIQGKKYVGVLDYDVQTKQATLADLSLENEPVQPEITLNEENIHTNQIYEKGYKYIYMKYGLELYELTFSRMTALVYDRSTELKFVFVGGEKAVIIAIIVGPEETYTLWKEQKDNGEEIKLHVENLRQIDALSKEPNFQAVLAEAIASKAFSKNDVEVANITALSKEEYLFVIYVKSIKIRYVVRALYSTKTQTVTIKKMEEVFHPQLQLMKEPEKPQSKVLDKQTCSSNSEAKEAFDYLYKVRPSFRQTQVEAVQIDTASEIKTISIMQIRDGKEYRTVILKDQKTGELQLVDESPVTQHPPTTTVIEHQSDGSTSVTTNKVDLASKEAKTIFAALKRSNIDTTTATISTLQTIEGPRAIEYIVVLSDASGSPAKQVTIVQSRESEQTVVTDVLSIENKIQYVSPVAEAVTVIPATQFYRQEIKDLVTLIQHNSETSISIAKIKSIQVSNNSLASRYTLTVENAKGEDVTIDAVQDKTDQSVRVISVRSTEETVQTVEKTLTSSSRSVSSYGVSIEYTNDKSVLSTDQNINIAVAAITTQLSQYKEFTVVSSLTKTFTQNQIQTLILSDGTTSVQVTGTIDIKTLRYLPLEHKPVPLSVTYPLLQQSTIPALVYPTYVKDHREVKDSEAILLEKYKIFKGKLPASATVELYGEVVKTTFHYEIGAKKFVAVVDFNTATRTGKVVEMSPVQENVLAVTVETREEAGQSITTSNSVQEIRTVNEHTDSVLTTITTQYPLLKKYNVTQVAVSEGVLSDSFQVTYTDSKTSIATVITTVSDKQGSSIIIENIETREPVSQQTTQSVKSEVVVITKEEYASTSVQELVKFVEEKTTSISNITKITAELSSSTVTYHLEVVSNGKTVNVVVIEHNGEKEVVAVRSTSAHAAVTQTTTIKVDQHGNQITETNNVTIIKESQSVQTSIKTIIAQAPHLQAYDVQHVTTTHYGDLQEIVLTFDSPQATKPLIQSIVFYNQTDKTVKVVSVQQTESVTVTEQTTQVTAAPTPYIATRFIPGFAVQTVAESDKTLKAVITSIQTTSTAYSTATTISTEVQTISEEAVKYTVVLDVNGEKTQAVYIANPITVQITPITITKVSTESVAYYYSTSQSETGTTITSNSVQQIAVSHPEVKDVLAFASTSLIVSTGAVVESVTLTTSVESTTYTIQAIENSQTKSFVLTWDSTSKDIKLVDLNVETVSINYPSKEPLIAVDISDRTLVQSFTTTIEKSNIAAIQNVKEVVSVSKSVTSHSEKVFVEVVNMESVKYLVTLEKNIRGEYSVISTVAESQTVVQDVGVLSVLTDVNGNNVTETSQAGEINIDVHAQTTVKEVVRTDVTLKEYHVTKMKKIDYGTIEEIQLVFTSEKENLHPVQTISFFNKTDSTVKVVHLEHTEKVTVTEDITTEVAVAIKPYVETKFIAGFAIQTAIETDKTLKSVITSIQSTYTTLSTATTVSAEVSTISEEAVKYTVILEVNGEKSQAVYIVNPVTVQITPITVTKVPTDIRAVYIQHETTSQGSHVVHTNNVTYIQTTHVDFKDVSTFITSATGVSVTSENTEIHVTTQNTLNTYTITTTKDSVTKTVVVSSDSTTNTQFLVSYHESTPALTVVETDYKEVAVTVEQKENYLGWVKTIKDQQTVNAINVVSVHTSKNTLYTETLLEVEVVGSQNIFIKTIKTPDSPQPQVISITPAPHPLIAKEEITTTTSTTSTTTSKTIAVETTVQRSDSVGNLVIESTHPIFISENVAVQSVISSLTTSHTEYSSYSVKYTKTVELGKSTQVLLTLEGRFPTDTPIQAIAFYDTTTKTSKIVQVQEIVEVTVSPAPYPVPNVFITAIPATAIAESIKQDTALKTVVTQITKSSSQFQSATVSSVEIQTFDEKTVQYNIVMDVKGQKHQFVHIYNKTANVATAIGVTQLSADIKTVLHTQTRIDSEEVIISNRIEAVRQEYPQTSPTIDIFIQENPTLTPGKIDSIMVSPSSEGSTVSIVAKNQQETSYIFTKYVTSESAATVKVESHTVPLINIVRPKPIVSVAVSSEEILSNQEVTAQLVKLIKVDSSKSTFDTTSIISIEKSESTSVDVYTVRALDANNQVISIQLHQQSNTRIVKVVDAAKVNEAQMTHTETTVQEFTGKSEVLTTNTATIKESKEFKKITEYITKNHPTQAVLIASPFIENTEKYQRASIKTICFSQEGKTIQGTYLIDQRSNMTIELSFGTALPLLPGQLTLPLPTPTTVLTATESIIAETKTNVAITNTLTVIQKVDFSLANLTPTFVEIKNYTNAATITLVFETPTSNSRILSFYNAVTKEAKVIDYTKVAKIIEASRTVETVNELGQTTLFTTSTKTVTSTEEFTSVWTTAVKSVPAIWNKPIKGVSTTTHQNGKEFTVLTVESGVISQVVLRIDTTTSEVSFISHTTTSVASEVVATLPKPHPTKLSFNNIKDVAVQQIATHIVKDSSLGLEGSTVVSGSVTTTEFVQTYDLVVQVSGESKTVKVVKNIKTGDFVVNNVQNIPKIRPVEVKTTTKQNSYGQVEVVTNNHTEIITTEEISTIIKTIRVKKPQFITAKPISAKTVTYGYIVESTLVFSDFAQTTLRPIQITSILNTTTGVVQIIDSRSFSVHEAGVATVANPIQVIPAPAIKIAAKKNVEISQIITSVQQTTTSTTQIETLTMQNFGNVNKYVAIAPTATGKQELVYFFDKTTNVLTTISSRAITTVLNPVVYSETVNHQGETVITSTSVEKITASVTEVSKAVELLTSTFSATLTQSIVSVQSTGTTVKEIQFVTVDSRQQQTVITVIADSTAGTVKIMDVKQPTPVRRERDEQGERGGQGGERDDSRGEKGVRVVPATPADRKAIQTVLETSTEIDTTTFQHFTVTSVTATQSAFTTTFIATIEDRSSGVSANVTLIQNPGEKVQVINVHSNVTESHVVQSEVVTKTTTSTVTGEVRVITNDRKTIEKDHTVKEITKNIVKSHPELTLYQAVATQTVVYQDVQETTVVLHSEGEVSVQATVIYNTSSSTVQVLNVQKLHQEVREVTVNAVKTIPAPAIKIAAKKNIEISQIITSVQQVTTTSTQIETLTVQNIGNVRKYVAIAPVESGKQQVVFLYDKATQKLQQISSQTLSTTITVLNVEQTTSKWGETVLTSNNVQYVTQKYPDTVTATQTVDAYFQQSIASTIQSVQVVEQSGEVSYKLVVEVDKVTHEVAVGKVDGKYVVQNVHPHQPTHVTTLIEKKHQESQKVEGESVTGSEITKFIHSSSNTHLAKGEIVSITATESLVSTLYTVEVKDSTSKVTVVELLSQPGEGLVVLGSKQQQTTVTETVQESFTSKTVNSITSQTVTTSTDVTVIQNTENTLYFTDVVKIFPAIQQAVPVLIQTTVYGSLEEKTLIVQDSTTTIQVTTIRNTTTNEMKVIHNKTLTIAQNETITHPETFISVISAPLIIATSSQIPQITTILASIKKTTQQEVTLESITIEDLGRLKKFIAVHPTPAGRQHYVYLQEESTQTVTLLESYTVKEQVHALVYERTINQFGEITVTSNNATEATIAIPDLVPALGFISTKYPAAKAEHIALIHAVEYPAFYQSSVTVESETGVKVTIRVNVDKATKEVTEVGVFSPADVHVERPRVITSPTTVAPVPVPADSPVLANVIHFIEAAKEVPVNEIKSVTKATSSHTVFGSEVITLEAVASDSSRVEVVVSYNASTKEVKIQNYQLLEAAPTLQEAVTEFRVDVLTGTKTTTTNDTTIIVSSEINTALIKELTHSHSELTVADIVSSTTVEYPDKVKVVTHFESPSVAGYTQVTSIYDKLTSSVRVIDTTTTTTTTSTESRQVFTSSEVQTAQKTVASVPATTAFLTKEFPIYSGQVPSAVVVESVGSSHLVSYIYESSSTVKMQVMVMYNSSSGESTLLESSPVRPSQPFFYEEKRNSHGHNVVLSNNLTEVVQRIPKTELLQTYLQAETEVDTAAIRTVESTVGTTYNTYTLVVDTAHGLQQYGFLVNTQTEEVKTIENKTLPGINNVFLPQPRPRVDISPQSEDALPILNSVIASSASSLTTLASVVSVTKTELSTGNSYNIEYVDSSNQLTKVVVAEGADHTAVVVDQWAVPTGFIAQPPVVIAETIDSVTKTSSVTYASNETFQVDINSAQILQYAAKNIAEVENYTLGSVRKTVYGQIEQYDLLYKSDQRAPLQVSIANDNNNKNLLLLETKRISEPEIRSVLDSSAPLPQPVEVSDIEKENIKVLSKLGTMRDVKEYKEVALSSIGQNEQFVAATEAVKQSYSVLLKESVIIKVLEKNSLQSKSVKVFFKAKDQIYEASIEINPITGDTKLVDFIKISAQTTTKSEVNVYADLCYGYQAIEDHSADSNLDFLLTYMRAKHEQLREASLTEAQSIVLGSGRINYKLYFKKDSQTVKYIVYYEPEYKRVLEVKGTSFLIGGKFASVPAEQQVADPYFRKLDTYIRQNRAQLTSASVLHTESDDDGSAITFRTVYSAAGKTYRSTAAISKDSQNIDESALSEIVEIPTTDSPADVGENDESLAVSKLDVHDLGKNLYFTEAHRHVQAKYPDELDKAQLLGASCKTSLFSYLFREFYMVDDKIITVSAEYNPVTQTASIVAEPQVVDVQEGFFHVKSDWRLTEVRNWLKEKNLDLSSAVMVSSMSKPILFGFAYKLLFKDLTRYYTYVVYYDATTREMRILFEKDSSQPEATPLPTTPTTIEPKLKGFARPLTTSTEN